MPAGVFLSKTELHGDDEQRHGRIPRDVLDCGRATALDSSAGTLRVQSGYDTVL